MVSFIRRRWSQWNLGENRNIQGNQMNDIQGLPRFLLLLLLFLTSPSSFRRLVTFWVQIGTNLSYLLQNDEICRKVKTVMINPKKKYCLALSEAANQDGLWTVMDECDGDVA